MATGQGVIRVFFTFLFHLVILLTPVNSNSDHLFSKRSVETNITHLKTYEEVGTNVQCVLKCLMNRKEPTPCAGSQYVSASQTCDLYTTVGAVSNTLLDKDMLYYVGSADPRFTSIGLPSGQLLTFSLSESMVSYPNALAECQSMGSHLLHVDNSEKITALVPYFISHGGHRFMVGITDRLVEGQWVHDKDGTAVDHSQIPWNVGEPNNAGGNEDCAGFYPGSAMFNDFPCDGYTASYVCEKETTFN